MAKFKVRVKAETIVEVDPENYVDAWQEYQEENGDLEEGESAGPVPEAFAFEQYQEGMEEGNEELPDFETIEVTRV